MAWIETVNEEQADGLLARTYAQARKRAGRIWNILRVMSRNPRQLQASLGIDQSVMLRDSLLSRRVRELLGVDPEEWMPPPSTLR